MMKSANATKRTQATKMSGLDKIYIFTLFSPHSKGFSILHVVTIHVKSRTPSNRISNYFIVRNEGTQMIRGMEGTELEGESHTKIRIGGGIFLRYLFLHRR